MATLSAAELFGTPAQDSGAPTPLGVTGAPSKGLLTSDQLFPQTKPVGPPETGAAFDTIWSQGASAAKSVMDAFGMGAQNVWGARPIGVDPDTESALQKAGIWNDYKSDHDDFLKTVNEAWMRPVITAGDALWRTLQTPFAIAGGAGAAAQEVQQLNAGGNVAQRVAGGAAGAVGELLTGAAEGDIGPEFGFGEGDIGLGGATSPVGQIAGAAIRQAASRVGRTEAVNRANAARSVGAVGEGEAGYYDAEPITPENLAAREEAAAQAGVEPIPPEPPPADIHELARRIDPDTFAQYDALALEREEHRATIQRLGDERENSPEALEAQAQIDTILGKVRGVESRLTGAARERLAAAQERLDLALTDDTPEMRQARSAFLEADFAMRDLAPDVSAAYRQAREMAPDVPTEAPASEPEAEKPVETAKEPPKPGVEGEQQGESAQISPEVAAGVRAAPVEVLQAAAEGQPANVLGEQTLGNVKDKAGTNETATGRDVMPEVVKSPSIMHTRVSSGFNGLFDRLGRPIRFKNFQKFVKGGKVKVGFMDDLTVEGSMAATDTEDAAFVLSKNGVVYKFTPHKGLTRLDEEDGKAALEQARNGGSLPQNQIQPARPAEPEPIPPPDDRAVSQASLNQAAKDVAEYRSKPPPKSHIFQAIKELGGLKLRDENGVALPGPDVEPALNGALKKPPGLVNNAKGLSPEKMHEALAEQGWIKPANEDPEALVRALEKQGRGEDVFHPDSGLKEAHQRRAVLDKDMHEAGVDLKDKPAVAARKLAEYRETQQRIADHMDVLRQRADELGVEHGPETTYDQLLADVIERDALMGDGTEHGYDTYERDIDAALTDDDIRWLARSVEEQHGEGGSVGGLPEDRGRFASETGRVEEPASGATIRGEGPSTAGDTEGDGRGGNDGTGRRNDFGVEGTGPTRTRGVSATTEARALEAGLDDTFGDLPDYNQMSKADQAARVVAEMDRDWNAAVEIAMGDRAPPRGILPESFYEGVRMRAMALGDWDTVRMLATESKLVSEATEMGRRIGMYAKRDPLDPVAAIQDVTKAREAALGRNAEAAKAQEVAAIKNEVAKAASNEDAWLQFVNDIRC